MSQLQQSPERPREMHPPTEVTVEPIESPNHFARHGAKWVFAAAFLGATILYVMQKPVTDPTVRVELPTREPIRVENIVPVTPPKPVKPVEEIKRPFVEETDSTAERSAKEPPKDPSPARSDEPPPSPFPDGTKPTGPGDFTGGPNGKGKDRGGPGGSGGSRSKWGWYAGKVQARIAEALRSNHATRAANIQNLEVWIWPDSKGRIVRAKVVKATGDTARDTMIESSLVGTVLDEPPPPDMPLPIKLRINATPQVAQRF